MDFASGAHLAEDTSYHLSSRDAVDAAKRQKVYFEAVDRYILDVDQFRHAPLKETDTLDRRIGEAKMKMAQAYGDRRSETVVVEAAFFLLQEGLLNIPDLGVINVKQARAFLWNAAWLQEHMSQRWRQEAADLAPGTVVDDGRAELFKSFQLVIIGPGGTGKTAVLKVTEALTIFFAGAETVQKLAPSNAAARLLGGDTLHALCKLPFGQHTLTSKKGRLQNHKLQNLRRKWNRVIAAYIDEISMVPANQFLQCDTRIRQAKKNNEDLFGGICINVCGDHLQLPPVDKDGTRKSLAKPLDDVGDEVEEILAGTDPKNGYKTEALAEGRQGFELWRRFRTVVSLSVNVRAPDALGRLQAEMRAGKLSDAMWDLYMDRVAKPLDPRLSDPASPFVKHDVHFIVHRHKIRIMRSLENARTESKRLQTPLYMVQACDEVVHREDETKLTNAVRTTLLQMVNPGETRGLPSFLPLYRGMRLLLASKDCVRLGIMKGCPVILRDIVFGDEEVHPDAPVAGHPYSLEFMPFSLLLQAENAFWQLPVTELPSTLPAGVDRRGLFQLRPSFDYLRVLVDDAYITVRRTTYLATPADTITVYAAQGGTFDAVVADMQRPPNLDLARHWLACYVMLSRARSINGFLILRPAKRTELESRPPQYLLDEIDRLLQLEEESHPKLVEYIDSLPLEIPAQIRRILEPEAKARELRLVEEARSPVAADEHPRSNDAKNEGAVSSDARSVIKLAKRLTKKTPRADVDVGAARLQVSVGPALPSMPTCDVDVPPLASETASSDLMAAAAVTVTLAGIVGLAHSADTSLGAAETSTTAKRRRTADAAETRATELASRGIGGPNHDTTRASGTKRRAQDASGDVPFGAMSRDALRRRLDLPPRQAQDTPHLVNSNGGAAAASASTADVSSMMDSRESVADGSAGVCGSCHRAGHTNCLSPLCEELACGYCYSFGLITHEDSEDCRDLQESNYNCHSCGRTGCFATSENCHSICTPLEHVCGPSDGQNGCTSCGRLCHVDNGDRRCAYFKRPRNDLMWAASEADLGDTVPGTGGRAPHRSQVNWRFVENSARGKTTIVVEGQPYYIGWGNPGQSKDGEKNNCLIDSLLQCIGVDCSRKAVRRDLVAAHEHDLGRAKVTFSSYLDVSDVVFSLY